MKMTRREFMEAAAAVAATLALPRSARGEVSAAELARDPMRPQFHLLPARNWMNDPNGPVFFNGKYHMFFQYNPNAPVWGDMNWNHAVSEDMLHWKHLPLALSPTPGSADAYGCFTGSAIVEGKRVYMVYTGVKESTQELATIRDGQDKIQESQCLAWSDDPDLLKWTKMPQPIVPLPPPGMKVTGFRDPSVWKQNGMYYMTVGCGIANTGGCVLLYRSKDLHQWEYMHPLISGQWDGKKTQNPVADGEMWECPEFFALDGGHVLIYSTLGKVFWQSGVFDEKTMRFTGAKTGVLDLGAYYAPKTQLDATGRRILWGWITERRKDAELREAGWAGMMSLPRLLRLDHDGTLRMDFLPQTASLRGENIPSSTAAGSEISVTLPTATGELLCESEQGSEFSLTFSEGDTELMRVHADGSGKIMVDDKEIPVRSNRRSHLHAFVDGSVIELMVNHELGYTKRFYYQRSTAPDIHVRMIGLRSTAWKIERISSDRLTTPAHL